MVTDPAVGGGCRFYSDFYSFFLSKMVNQPNVLTVISYRNVNDFTLSQRNEWNDGKKVSGQKEEREKGHKLNLKERRVVEGNKEERIERKQKVG